MNSLIVPVELFLIACIYANQGDRTTMVTSDSVSEEALDNSGTPFLLHESTTKAAGVDNHEVLSSNPTFKLTVSSLMRYSFVYATSMIVMTSSSTVPAKPKLRRTDICPTVRNLARFKSANLMATLGYPAVLRCPALETTKWFADFTCWQAYIGGRWREVASSKGSTQPDTKRFVVAENGALVISAAMRQDRTFRCIVPSFKRFAVVNMDVIHCTRHKNGSVNHGHCTDRGYCNRLNQDTPVEKVECQCKSGRDGPLCDKVSTWEIWFPLAIGIFLFLFFAGLGLSVLRQAFLRRVEIVPLYTGDKGEVYLEPLWSQVTVIKGNSTLLNEN